MPRGCRIVMLKDMKRSVQEHRDDAPYETGFFTGEEYNVPTHLAKLLIRKGYAKKVNEYSA